MSDPADREWRFYVDDMIECAEKNDTLWSIITSDVPALLPQLSAVNSGSA